MAIELACPDCISTELKRWEERIAKKGIDWFICKECGLKFPFRRASYIGGNE